MKVALFGAGGFIGSHLVEGLLAEGEQVVGVDREDEKLEGISGPGLLFHKADIRTEPELVDAVIRTSDVVVDLVAYANPSRYVQAPLDVVDVNFRANLDIVERCARYARRLIQFSSAEVYGKFVTTEGFVTEDSTPLVYGPVNKHRWIYASAKQLLERIIHAHGLAGHLEFTIIRPFNFVGPRLDYLVPAGAMGGPRVVPHFISALLTGGPMFLVDGGDVRRTFLHIDDAREAFLTLLRNPARAHNEIFNVGNPANNIAIRDLAGLMMRLYEELTGNWLRCELVKVSGEEFYGVGYDDSDRLPPDITKLTRLGWTPQRDLEAALRDTLGYYLARRERGAR